jgi:hypothetical protein
MNIKPPAFWEYRHLSLFGVHNMLGYSRCHADFFLRGERRSRFDRMTEDFFLSFSLCCWKQWPWSSAWHWRWFKLWWLQARHSGWRRTIAAWRRWQPNPGNACHFK